MLVALDTRERPITDVVVDPQRPGSLEGV